MAEQDVTADVVSEETAPTPVAPVQAATEVDPVEAKVKELLQKERASILEEAKRLGQSGKDKRLNLLQQELREEKARRIAMESAFENLPKQLGPDADPMMLQNVRMAQKDVQLSSYQRQEQARQEAQVREEQKQEAIRESLEEVETLGIAPDDKRLQIDLDAPDYRTFRKTLMASVRKIQSEEQDKVLNERLSKHAADLEAKIRKDSGVDSQDSTGSASGKETFSKAQFLDRRFYKEHKEAMEKAVREGRIQD
jgi:hypothetical protein